MIWINLVIGAAVMLFLVWDWVAWYSCKIIIEDHMWWEWEREWEIPKQ